MALELDGDTLAKPLPNKDLIATIKKALNLAEAGIITNMVIVATGPKVYHRTYSIANGEDYPMMIGEMALFQTEMELIVMRERTPKQG